MTAGREYGKTSQPGEEEFRFILDVHLGRLAKYLRLCGFDTLFSSLYDDAEIIDTAGREERIILSRDRRLVADRRVRKGYCIRSQYHDEQLREVFDHFKLRPYVMLFSRCIICNEMLIEAGREDVKERLQPDTLRYFTQFRTCPVCDRIYWQGSHYENMIRHLPV